MIAGASRARLPGRQFLHRDHFHEIGHRQAAAQARRAAGRQHVVRTGSVIAGRFGTVRPTKTLPALRILSSSDGIGNAQVLGRKAIRELDCLVQDRTRTIALLRRSTCARPPRSAASRVAARSRLRPLMASACEVVSRIGRGVDVVLGLRQHVGGDHARIAVRGDDQDLGGPGDEVDADFARQQLLRRGDVDIAGADDAVGARHRRVPKAKAAMACAPPIWKTSRNPRTCAASRESRRPACGEATQMSRHARHLRRDHRHQQRGGQRIAARRDVRATVSSGRTIWPSLRPLPNSSRSSRAASAPRANARMLRAAVVDGCAESRASGALQRRSSVSGTRTRSLVEAVELARVLEQRASPRVRTASRIGRTTASASIQARTARASAAACACDVSKIRIIGTLRSCSADTPQFPARPPPSAAE